MLAGSCLLAADGPSTDDLSAVRRALSGRPLGQELQVCEHYRPWAQLTYRPSLRDISLPARRKAPSSTIRGAVSRRSDANEQWRLRPTHNGPSLYVETSGTRRDRLALDSSTIDLCLTFLGRLPQDGKAAVAAHTSRPARLHPGLHPHLHRQAPRRQRHGPVVPEAGAFYVMDRAYVDFARLHRAHAFFVVRANPNSAAPSLLAPGDRSAVISPSAHRRHHGSYPDAAHQGPRRRARQDPGLPDQQLGQLPASTIASSIDAAGKSSCSSIKQHQILLRHLRERRADANLDRGRLRARRHHQEETQSGPQPLHNSPDPQHHRIREIADKSGAYDTEYRPHGMVSHGESIDD